VTNILANVDYLTDLEYEGFNRSSIKALVLSKMSLELALQVAFAVNELGTSMDKLRNVKFAVQGGTIGITAIPGISTARTIQAGSDRATLVNPSRILNCFPIEVFCMKIAKREVMTNLNVVANNPKATVNGFPAFMFKPIMLSLNWNPVHKDIAKELSRKISKQLNSGKRANRTPAGTDLVTKILKSAMPTIDFGDEEIDPQQDGIFEQQFSNRGYNPGPEFSRLFNTWRAAHDSGGLFIAY
jgi:hypothetical protein